MKDFLDKEVQVGDEVVITEPGYHNFIRGVIVKFTPKGVKVKYHRSRPNSVDETFVGEGGFIKVKGETK